MDCSGAASLLSLLSAATSLAVKQRSAHALMLTLRRLPGACMTICIDIKNQIAKGKVNGLDMSCLLIHGRFHHMPLKLAHITKCWLNTSAIHLYAYLPLMDEPYPNHPWDWNICPY